MPAKATSSVQTTYRRGVSPYSISRASAAVAKGEEAWPRGWGTNGAMVTTVKSRTTPAKQKFTVQGALSATMRMVLPVLALTLAMLAAYMTSGEPTTFFDGLIGGQAPAERPSAWLTQGHLIVCLGFLVINLTNRAYGPNFAAAQVAITWALLGGAASFLLGADSGLPTGTAVPDSGIIASFVFALVVGQLAAVLIFDLTRGPRWWTAPLWSALVGSLVFIAIFRLTAGVQGEGAWLTVFGTDLFVKTVMAIAMLVPYYILRPFIKPQPGFNGA